jgi:hypothetical protein
MNKIPNNRILKKSNKKIITINTVGNDPNGLPKRICQDCEKIIKYSDKALKSVMRLNVWICIPCFENKLGRKIDTKEIN